MLAYSAGDKFQRKLLEFTRKNLNFLLHVANILYLYIVHQ